MAKVFIHGRHLRDIEGAKQACLKIYRDLDEKELSIVFDNSLGGFGNECKRVSARIFPSAYTSASSYEKEIFITGSTELANVINLFLAYKENLIS
jgi:hypothetical protein